MTSVSEFVFCLGEYSFGVGGEPELLRMIPQYWHEYRKRNFEKYSARINLLRETLPRFDANYSGWDHVHCEEDHVVTLVKNGKAMFSIEYPVSAPTINVRVERILDTYVRASIHYALMIALRFVCVGLHGVTLRCGDQVIILSAPSGTGKSTLAELLQRYHNAEIINGDFALLSISDKGVMFEPTPICGTSRQCENRRLKVDKIVFLTQAADNNFVQLDTRSGITRMMSNAFVPTWDVEAAMVVQNNILRIVELVSIASFAFAPVEAAADMFICSINM